ncbi:30S ribosomal protein S6 [Candidatus Woesebacteria bacterium]|nr:30S ribosomal protein S6 [Candidatus Woesebacteria bacterium]|tara:strand:+ start:264 stop:605 length:342 start_codon:yes stop_codon:yes gene_type:complete
MQDYELTFVLAPDLAEAKQKEITTSVEKEVKGAGGKAQKIEKWGKRDLAYPIKKHAQGIYFFLGISLPREKVSTFDRFLQTKEEFLRHLIVKVKTQSSKVKGDKKESKKSDKI